MIVVDTNVISELLRPAPNSNVARWAQSVATANLQTTAINEAELLSGIALLPNGRRRNELSQALVTFMTKAFADRILPFTSAAAPHYADIIATRTATGRPISHTDAQIASICRLHNAAIVTRDSSGFEGLEVKLIDPWTD